MAKELRKTIDGRRNVYEIYYDRGGFLESDCFRVYRNGKYWKKFSRLDKAVEAAKEEDK